jgi:DNA-binding winged helix-turn-helix (wHTH) protein
MRRNPFFNRGPIRYPDSFCGRESEVEELLSLLLHRQSIALVGPRRIGKTSLLLHASQAHVLESHGLQPDRFVFIYCDVLSWADAPAGEIRGRLLERTCQALGDVGQDFSSAVDVSHRALEKAADSATRSGLQLVYVLDGFEGWARNPHADANLLAGLRALGSTYNVCYVTASEEPLLSLDYASAGPLTSSFCNSFAQISLGLFTEAAAGAMLVALNGQGGLAFDVGDIELALELAGPHPHLLQIAGYHTYATLSRHQALPQEERRERVRRSFLTEVEPIWKHQWSVLKPNEQRLLALLPVEARSDPEGVRQLEQKALVYRRDSEPLIVSPAFQEFVLRQKVSNLIQVPPITLEPSQRRVFVRGRAVSLSATEYAVLTCLLAEPGQIVTKDRLGSEVWGRDYEHELNAERVKVAIKALRRALGADGSRIQNERGVGYRFAGQQR